MRRTVETAFELRTGGTPLLSWVVQMRGEGQTFPEIADRLSHLVGLTVRPATLRKWVVDG